MTGLSAFERAKGLELVQDKLNELAPQNEAQRQALGPRPSPPVGAPAQMPWPLPAPAAP
jgi:hypothetical protein